MKQNFKKSLMLVVTVIFISTATTVFAQGKKDKEKKEEIREMKIEEKGERNNDEGRCFGIKNLTDDQKQKMDKMKTTHQKEMMQSKNLLAEKKAHLKTIETVDNADMNAINKTIDEIGTMKTEMMKKKAAHKQEIRKILNEEQRLQFDMKHSRDDKREKEGKRMKRMRGGRGMDMEKDIEIKIIKEDDN